MRHPPRDQHATFRYLRPPWMARRPAPSPARRRAWPGPLITATRPRSRPVIKLW